MDESLVYLTDNENSRNDIRWYHKILFCWTLGWLSFFFAETFSTSTIFAFGNAFNILVTVPLYTFHCIVFISIVSYATRNPKRHPTLPTLFMAGALIGLYEAYITKVLWNPTWSPEWIYRVGGVSIPHLIILVFYWHPWFAFIVPVLVAEALVSRAPQDKYIKAMPNFILRAFQHSIVATVIILSIFTLYGGLNGSMGSPSILISASSGLTVLLIVLSAALLRFLTRRMRVGFDDLLFGKVGFIVCCVFLLIIYLFGIFVLRPEELPPVKDQVLIWALYLIFGSLLFFGLKMVPLDNEYFSIIPFSWTLVIYLSVLFVVIMCVGTLERLVGMILGVLMFLVGSITGFILFGIAIWQFVKLCRGKNVAEPKN